MYLDDTYLIFIVPTIILTLIAQSMIKNAYSKYSKVSSGTNFTGAEVARMILEKNGIYDVSVKSVPGQLSDHYDPRTKVVNLSEGVYGSNSVAALSIAAHEVGHAMQKDEEYLPLSFRTALVPLANIGTNISWVVLLAGFILELAGLINLGILLFGFGVLFQIITLPVEFNASRRAILQLADGIMPEEHISKSKKVLRAAAMTYVAAALAMVAQLARFIVLSGRRNND